jgi:hypothetical protein
VGAAPGTGSRRCSTYSGGLGFPSGPKGSATVRWLDGDRRAARNRRAQAARPPSPRKNGPRLKDRRDGTSRGVAVCLCFPAIRESSRGCYQGAPFGVPPPSLTSRARSPETPTHAKAFAGSDDACPVSSFRDAPPNWGLPRVRQYHCPSRQQPTWMRRPGIHTPRADVWMLNANTGVMDSGLARRARPGMTDLIALPLSSPARQGSPAWPAVMRRAPQDDGGVFRNGRLRDDAAMASIHFFSKEFCEDGWIRGSSPRMTQSQATGMGLHQNER